MAEQPTHETNQTKSQRTGPYWRPWLPLVALVLVALLLGTPHTAQAKSIAVGQDGPFTSNFACAITSGGTVTCWGILDNTYYAVPTVIPGLSGIKSIAAGSSFACALDSSNGVKCWGNNTTGQLGDGTGTSRATPQYVTGLSSGVAQIFAGGYNACAITVSGGAMCWGSNGYGEVGNGSFGNIVYTPAAVVGLSSGVLTMSVGISTAEYNSVCAVTTSGSVKCWGAYNGFETPGDTIYSTPVDVTSFTGQAIAVSIDGYGEGCVLDPSHHIKCWGRNRGDGDTSGLYTLTAVSPAGLANVPVADMTYTGAHCALLAAGSVKCWTHRAADGPPSPNLGNGLLGEWTTPQDVLYVDNAIEIAGADGDTKCIRLSSGEVQCWGTHYGGQIYVGYTHSNAYVPWTIAGLNSGGGGTFLPLGIHKSKPSPYPPVAGQPVSYSIVVTNTTTTNLTNVTVTDVPGPGLGSMTAFTSSPAGSCNTTTKKCTLSSALAPGAVATFNVTFNTSTTPGVVITNTAYTTATQWASYVYPETEPLAAETVSATNLSISKTASVTSATAGVPYNYTVTVTNSGTAAATNVTVKDNLPANVTYNGATASGGGSCGTPSGGVLTCTWSTLAPAASATVTINVTP